MKKTRLLLSVVLAAALLAGCSDRSPVSGSSDISSENSTSSTSSDTGSSDNGSSEISSTDSSPSESSSSENVSSEASKDESKPGTPAVTDNTPLGKHGALSVKGTDLTDANGEKFQLRGMSTHGLAWFPQFVNPDTFKFLRDDWNTNCVRLALYTYEYGGYCSGGDKEQLKALVKNGVEYATELGMYVIIDWHVLNERSPLTFKDEAKLFFDEMSKTFADNNNVLYEICNEPNSGPSWQDIKTYANEIIPVIRANDPDSVIIVGTPTWSQDIDQAAASPLEFENVMYTLHFYAATHTDWLRSRMESAINSGLPVFVSEFGICDASGNGGLSYDQGNAWRELIERYNVSYMCWNLANKNESSSILKESCQKLSGWEDGDLNDQGKWIRDWFKSETD